MARALAPAERTITFVELMELYFVKMFRDEQVSLQTIRRGAKTAARQFGSKWPFSVKRFDTDGKTIFATLVERADGASMVEDLKHGQFVFERVVRPFFKKLDYHGQQEVSRYWPLDKSGRVVLDPQRRFGEPIDDETGVPTRTVYDAFLANPRQDAAAIAAWLEMPVAAVKSAIEFEQSLVS